MDVTDIVSKGLNHLEVKYDLEWWVIKKWNSNECHDYVTKLIESHPEVFSFPNPSSSAYFLLFQ